MNVSKLCVTVLGVILLSACSHPGALQKDGALQKKIQQKIEFDLSRLDADGLYGPADGKRSLSYEFCIPAHVNTARQVMSIDPTAIVYKESPGRLQCGKEQYLVIGDTYQADYLVILEKLGDLSYITRIQEVFFE